MKWWSLRCSWSIAFWRCSNYIFILDLTPGFNGFGKGNCKMRWEWFKFWYLVHLILEILQYFHWRRIHKMIIEIPVPVKLVINHYLYIYIYICMYVCMHAHAYISVCCLVKRNGRFCEHQKNNIFKVQSVLVIMSNLTKFYMQHDFNKVENR